MVISIKQSFCKYDHVMSDRRQRPTSRLVAEFSVTEICRPFFCEMFADKQKMCPASHVCERYNVCPRRLFDPANECPEILCVGPVGKSEFSFLLRKKLSRLVPCLTDHWLVPCLADHWLVP